MQTDEHYDNFMLEKHKATIRSVQEHSFTSILNRHALVMFDAANPDLEKSDCIRLGARLAEVQSDWVNLLYCGRDREYRKAVTGIVKNFTNRLMDVVVDDKHVTFKELASIGLVHSNLSPHDQRRLDETHQLFQHYVASLCRLHNHSTQNNMHRAGLQVLHVANVLGACLDTHVYK